MVKFSTRRGCCCSKLDKNDAAGRMRRRSLRLPCKNNADRPGAGVAADGGTDVRLDDLLELAVLCKPGLDGLQTAGFGLAGGEEDDTGIDVVSVSQLLGDVFAHADGKLTAVLLDHL